MPNIENREKKRNAIMQKCFERYSETGFRNTSMKAAAEACGMTVGNIYAYFDSLDELIIESTEYCMSKVEDEFMSMAPTSIKDIDRFLDEAPEWTAKNHGAKYRLMYQIYTIPKYLKFGQQFFDGVNKRYTDYAKKLEIAVGVPWQTIQPLIFIFVRASVHYALFEDKEYLDSQIAFLKKTIFDYIEKTPKKSN